MEKSTSTFYQAAKKIWNTAGKTDAEYSKQLELELEFNKRLLNILQVGRYYYLVFNIFKGEVEFTSDGITDILGYDSQDINVMFILDNIHPDDKSYFLNFEYKSVEFFKALPYDKIKKYKSQYDFRIKTKNNQYARIFQQTIQIDYDETNFFRSLNIHTDITHIKKDGIPSLSIIGLDGEPSYYNIQGAGTFTKSYDIFTNREREILKCIVEGKNSKSMADELCISPHTVSTHRKNIMSKANCKTPIDLVNKVITEGWV